MTKGKALGLAILAAELAEARNQYDACLLVRKALRVSLELAEQELAEVKRERDKWQSAAHNWDLAQQETRTRAEKAEAALAVRIAISDMLAAVVEGAQEEFVRVPYGASHEDVANINEWHAAAKEALQELAAIRRGKT